MKTTFVHLVSYVIKDIIMNLIIFIVVVIIIAVLSVRIIFRRSKNCPPALIRLRPERRRRDILLEEVLRQAGIPVLRSHDARKLLLMTGEWLNTTGADQ